MSKPDVRLVRSLVLDNLHKMQFIQICNDKGIKDCEVDA